FPRVVLGDRDLLEGGGVDHHVHALEGSAQALAIADVAEKEAQRGMLADDLAHLGLLELVAREDDQPPRAMAREHPLDEAPSERARASRDEHGPIGEKVLGHPEVFACKAVPATNTHRTGGRRRPPVDLSDAEVSGLTPWRGPVPVEVGMRRSGHSRLRASNGSAHSAPQATRRSCAATTA